MFSLEQITQAHSKVKSGSDFPSYIKEIKQLGVVLYETYVSDGHTNYFGANNYQVSTNSKYDALAIAQNTNVEQFKTDIKAHQQGKTNYPTFCADCAKSGIEKWVVNLEEMTCIYFDTKGNELLVEQVPQ